MREMKKKREPDVVVEDAESYERLLELKDQTDSVETLRQRLASRDSKKGRTVDEFFREFFAKNNIKPRI
jgi:hypothetical protein